MSDVTEKIQELMSADKRLKLIFAAGLLGLLMIFLSGLGGRNEAVSASAGQMTGSQEYISAMETKLESLLQGIEGVGKTKVLLTVDQGPEYVYASEDKVNSDRYQDYEGNQPKKVQTKTTTENNFILVDDAQGNAQPLLKTQIEPMIKGVVVVCQGADSPVVCGRITEALTTALGIGANQVCIVPLVS